MTTDFRALCAELLHLDSKKPSEYAGAVTYENWRQQWKTAIARARAALADGPAMPEGIERDAARYRWIKAAPRLRIDRMPDSHFWISTETGEKYLVSHSLSAFNTGFSGLSTLDDLVDQAMNMYPIPPADEPTVPQGREPAAVTGQPGDQELLDIAASTIEPYECSGIATNEYEPETNCAVEAYGSELIDFARAVLARWGNPAPAPPADGDVAELVALLRAEAKDDMLILTPADLRRTAELLQRQALVPVAVSERLPLPGDCDEEGRCWFYRPKTQILNPYWDLVKHDYADINIDPVPPTHWLPARALPEVGE